MAKWAFDENVPRVRPRLRLGKALEEAETQTESPAEAAEAVAHARGAEPEPAAPPPDARVPEARVPEALSQPPEPEYDEAVRPEPEPARVVAPPEPEPVRLRPAARVARAEPEPSRPAPAAEPSAHDFTEPVDPEAAPRRSDMKRRAAVLAGSPVPVAPPALQDLEDLDTADAAARLAVELERAVTQAAEANEQLRRDLSMALDELARATAESKRVQDRADRLESEGRERAGLLQEVMREMELLEGERDSALAQASDATLALDDFREKMVVNERRVHELERSVADANGRARRFEEAVQAHMAQRAALRAELEGLRHERDGMVSRIAGLEHEREELGRSRRALDDVHRALSDAHQRAQRIRPR